MEIIQKKLDGNKVYIKPIGRLDLDTSAEFGIVVDEAIDDVRELLLDLAEVDYISSIGLRIILEIQKRMSKQGFMTISNVAPEVMEVFNMTGLSRILTIV